MPQSPSVGRRLLLALGVALAFFAVALLSLTFSKFAGRVAAIWPANAVLLTLTLRNRQNAWLVIAAGLAGNLLANLVTGDAIARAAILATLNALEVGLCFTMLAAAISDEVDLVRPRQLLIFVFGGALLTPVISGSIAATYLTHGGPEWSALFKVWWASDALGLIIFTPALLAISDRRRLRRVFRPDSRAETTLLLAGLLGVLALVFLQSRLPLLYVVPSALVLLTFRLGLAGGAIGVLLTAAVSIFALTEGRGPTTLVGPAVEDRVITLQCFLAFTALATLPLASVLGLRRDFERRINAEKAQAEDSAARLRETSMLAELAERMAGVGYWVYRTDTGERTWSSEMFRIYGVEGDEPLDLESAIGRYHPDDRLLVRQTLDRALETSEVQRLDLRIMVGDTERRAIACMQLLGEDGGAGRTLLGVLIDVTRSTQMERALKVSEARYQDLAELLPDLILRMSRDGRITYASPAARNYGYEPSELVGLGLHDLIHPEDVEQQRTRWESYVSSAGIDPLLRREQRLKLRDGGWVWLEGNPAQVRTETGEVLEVIKVFRDVTQRHALEEALTTAREQAELALRIKGEFLANMSHELRTPLTAIIGFSRLLTAVSTLPPREADFASRIERASKSLLALVNDVLDLSKLEAGGFEFEVETVSVADLVEECLAMVASQAEAKSLVLEARIDGIETFRGDVMRVRQVLVNLLGNAVKFTRQGEVALSISRDADTLSCSVRDTGEGISAEQLERIFDRFTQADGSTVRRYGGSGLGLAIARGLVEGMGGRMWAESTLGEGSAFHFTLPLGPASRPS
jgi:PAS domain S-box-containing protein